MPPTNPSDRRPPSRARQTKPIDATPPQEFRPTGVVRSARGSTNHPSSSRYVRARDLPRLLLMWPEEIADDTFEGRTRLIKKLRRVLRQERQRGIAGHWTYDLARHAALYRAYRHELERHTGAAAQASPARVAHAPAERLDATRPRDACRAPFSSPTVTGQPRNWAPPSDSRAVAPIWCGIHPASVCNGSEGAASTI